MVTFCTWLVICSETQTETIPTPVTAQLQYSCCISFKQISLAISLDFHHATCWCGSTASGEHIKRTQCLWNQIFQASFLGSWTLMDLISTAEVSILRWTALSWVSLWNLSEQKCYFQQKSDRFSPRAGDENGALWAPGDGFKSIAAEKWAAMHKNLRRKKIETSAFLKLAFIIHP